MAGYPDRLEPGSPYPLGATWDGLGTNFAVVSAPAQRADLSLDRRDSAAGMVKGVVTDESFNWADDRPPNVPWSDTVIYETHLRGLTMLCEDIRPNERGTFAALADPKIIDHLRRLGITA